MKIEYIEFSLSEVLDYFQKDFRLSDGSPIKYYAKPLVDTIQGKVCFRLYIDEGQEWDRRFHQNERFITKRSVRKIKRKSTT